eukprot:8989505-Alexandrium_andersonii.AAC.1
MDPDAVPISASRSPCSSLRCCMAPPPLGTLCCGSVVDLRLCSMVLRRELHPAPGAGSSLRACRALLGPRPCWTAEWRALWR